MDTSQKRTLTAINKIARFNNVITKLTLRQPLSEEERSFALTSAVIFLNEYGQDRKLTSYAELAYYIILKYALISKDYHPLYDFSASFGFYPITRKLIDDGLVDKKGISDELVDVQLDLYQKESYTETLQQHDQRSKLMADPNNEVAYIAPTSYGKSSVIVDYIRRHLNVAPRIAIIVPKKSLLMQTYRMIRKANLGMRLLMHDEMYNQEQRFIAILTQERCLRLLVKTSISFDMMFIDEAHNLLENDERSILLARLIKRNKARNVRQKVLYLSPLIQDAGNLKTARDQQIVPYAVPFNIKEPDIFEYRSNGTKYQYNRFVNEFYELDKYKDIFHYILSHAKLKNFLFCNRPILIEELAKLLTAKLPVIEVSKRLREVINTLKEEVHEQFFLVDYLEKGVVYLHGKLPDLIKEYVESKFTDIPELKYLIANVVILEGMNLPIDNLYILSASVLNPKQTTNLIGRVNRLNTIFAKELPPEALEKLNPPVHFVNSQEYNRENGNMTNNIKELRSRVFEDEIENCTLANYDVEKLNKSRKDKDAQRVKDDLTLTYENHLTKEPETEREKLRQYLIETGIAAFYKDIEHILGTIELRVSIEKMFSIGDRNFLDLVYTIFIQGLENDIEDEEFERLRHPAARRFYHHYVNVVQRRALNQNIRYLVTYFQEKIDIGEPMQYFGTSYGEMPGPFTDAFRKTYINLATKKTADLVNLAIVKLKMEDDFVSFKLNKLIIFLHDYALITTDQFNELVYGTTNQNKIEMTKLGMSISLINRLQADKLLQYLFLDEHGNLSATPEFDTLKASMSDMYRFEVNRFLG